jgi:hypothetical protein
MEADPTPVTFSALADFHLVRNLGIVKTINKMVDEIWDDGNVVKK